MEKPDYYDSDVVEFNDLEVTIHRKIKLPKGKTTLEGEYKKFNQDSECAYPQRASCNSGLFFKRCPYMKFKSLGKWGCSFKKNG